MERLASRIMLPMKECKVYSDLDLYTGVQMIDWTEIFTPDATFAVHFNGVNDEIRNSQYGALRVKDAIVDCFTRKTKNDQTSIVKTRICALTSGSMAIPPASLWI